MVVTQHPVVDRPLGILERLATVADLSRQARDEVADPRAHRVAAPLSPLYVVGQRRVFAPVVAEQHVDLPDVPAGNFSQGGVEVDAFGLDKIFVFMVGVSRFAAFP